MVKGLEMSSECVCWYNQDWNKFKKYVKYINSYDRKDIDHLC